MAAWLPAAARRVSGELILAASVGIRATDAELEAEAIQGDTTIEFPCFENATTICLDLGSLGLSVPPAGVFARLTALLLRRVWFNGPCEIGHVVSSPRCPCLQKLTIDNVWGLDSITIDSESLKLLMLNVLYGVRQITIVAPALSVLGVFDCFNTDQNMTVVNISAPQLKMLQWDGACDPRSIDLGSMEHLQALSTTFFVFEGHVSSAHNLSCLMLLLQFKAITITDLFLSLVYPREVHGWHYYSMEDMTVLPDVTSLHLTVRAKGHAFGACIFHVIRICSGIKRLMLVLSPELALEEQTACSASCVCDQSTNWKTEDVSLDNLQELEINECRASEHEIAFVKRLLSWVKVLKTVTVTFHHSVTESKAKELFQMFQSFSRPGMCIKFYMYQNFSRVLSAPED